MKTLRLTLALLFTLFLFTASFGCASHQDPGKVVLFPSPSLEEKPDPSAVIQKAKDATVVLVSAMGSTRCTAQFLTPKIMVSALHCVTTEAEKMLGNLGIEVPMDSVIGRKVPFVTYEDALNNLLDPDDMYAREATVFGGDPSRDIVFMGPSHDYSSPAVVEVERSEPKAGQPVFSLGHPVGLLYSFSAGHVSTACRLIDDVCWLQAAITVAPGSSGGGLYTEEGKLLGITSFIIRGYSLAFFVPADAILEAFKG